MMNQLKDTFKLMTLVLSAQLVWATLVVISPIPIHKIMLSTSYIMGLVFSVLIFINYKDKIKHEVVFFILALVLNYFAVVRVLEVLGS